MKLIVGLGNPDAQYRGTRHNVGFWCVEEFAKARSLQFVLKDKFKARIAGFGAGDAKVIIAQPTTYYNLSGEAVRIIADFYRISPRDILLVYDDMALPFGTMRTRWGGSDAGNNGVKSVTDHIGQDTARLRIGTANELRDRIDDADFVLSRFSVDEVAELDKALPHIIETIEGFITNKFIITTHTKS